ncbi:Uncharacterised protein [uncultured archaeon]|nr:Uncharacterised protein [uncultured archaeon]
MEKEQIKDLMLSHLRESFSLFRDDNKVHVHLSDYNHFCIGYRTNGERLSELKGTTHFDIELIDDICYILYIELVEEERGMGIGWSLYETIHKFAKDYGAKKVRQTPSGWTPQGKTRRDYLLSRKYAPMGENELELIL